ncbi:MAG: bifunctional glutamate N-acetyltransferase/amino-acid acetyltransferase ArgJ [Candidatus Omnitrophica bacterium]|nr:bifunctional glutamate N-acetyltransferase/amino-acid acetyltransferase ArgJ [Candidatus Omnitrophota bacterium]
MSVKVIKGGITAAKGFQCSSTRAGFKKKGDDMALIYSKAPAVCDGVFTQNQVQAAPVIISRQHLKQDLMSQAVIVNSGCANCCTGPKGLKDAERTAELTAKALAIKKEDVLVASTGMIGTFLDMKKIERAVPVLVRNLKTNNSAAAAKAIMTTDTRPKEFTVKINIAGKDVAIGAIAKGAGMIHPNMATMLCFITTDISITRRALKLALEEAVNKSFNAISVDGDTSTNDSVIIMANGAAGNRLIDKVDREFKLFSQALGLVTVELARMIARDGEGAAKFVEIVMKNCPSLRQGIKAGRRLAISPLLKTCIYGGDPNWGRVAAALGTCGIRIKENTFDIYLGKTQVVKNGVSLNVKKEKLKGAFKGKDISITVDLKLGRETATVWTCDMTEEYIKINAEYET